MAYPFTWVVLSTTITLILFIIRFYTKTHWNRRAQLINRFPRPSLFPIVGNGFKVFGRPNQLQPITTQYFKKYGRICGFWWFDQPRILIADAGAAEKILSSSAHIEKGDEYEVLKVHFGEGLFTSSGHNWRRDRKLLNPGFARNKLDGFVKICNRRSKIMVEEVSKSINNPIVWKNMVNVALEIVFESSLGTELNIQGDEHDSKFADGMDTVLKVSQIRLSNPWLVKIPFLYKLLGYEKYERDAIEYCKSFTRKIWQSNKEETSNSEITDSSKTKSFLQLLLEADGVSEQYCLDHLNTVVFAGSESTANSMSNALFYLALYPEHQKRCQEDIDALFDLQPDHDLDLTQDSLRNLPYLEQCWKEGMRLRPILSGISRRVMHDVKLDNGLIIPKGCDAVILLHDLHHDPSVFPEPDTFNPDRFSEEKSLSRSRYAYLPFGAGLRHCVGHKFATLEAKIVLAHFLRNFTISTVQSDEDVKYVPGIVSFPEPTFQIAVRKRSWRNTTTNK